MIGGTGHYLKKMVTKLKKSAATSPPGMGHPLTLGSHDHPIAKNPAHPLDLPLENLDLAPQHQHFSLQLGLVTMAGHQYVQ